MSQFTKRIAANNDDAHGAGAYWWNFNSISTGNNVPDLLTVALRWNNVTISNTATITSAYLTLTFPAGGGANNSQLLRIRGIDEDDTADFASDPRARSTTTAYADVSTAGGESLGATWTSGDIKAPIQEVISRDGWSSGNDLGIFILDNGSTYPHDWDAYNGSPSTAAYIEINYTTPSPSLSKSLSPSVSVSASPSTSFSLSCSRSISSSPSASASVTGSISVSASPSLSGSASQSLTPSQSYSASPSITPMISFFGLRVAKPDINVLTGDDPRDFIFSSDYGTLKYYTKQAVNLEIDANDEVVAASGSYTHNLGYYPYTEVYVKVWIDDPTLYNYQYCPFFNSGATVQYNATYAITTTQIKVFAEIIGVSTSLWNFDFIIFVFKNDLQL